MRRVPPRTVILEEIDELLTGGVGPRSNIISMLADLDLRYLAQHGSSRNRRTFWDAPTTSAATTGHGGAIAMATRTPPSRRRGRGRDSRSPGQRGKEPYRFKSMQFLDGNSDVLERLVVEMYKRGLSTRDVEDCFPDASGALLITRTAVSEITDQLEHFQAFCHRDLSEFDVCYLFLDSIYESLRRYGAKEGILAAWAITTDGRKVLLHLGWETRNPRRAGPSS